MNALNQLNLCNLKYSNLVMKKVVFIAGQPGTDKIYMRKGFPEEILISVRDGNCYKVCTSTHKSATIAYATTIFNLLNINPIDYTYYKSTVENLLRMVLNGYLLNKFQ